MFLLSSYRPIDCIDDEMREELGKQFSYIFEFHEEPNMESKIGYDFFDKVTERLEDALDEKPFSEFVRSEYFSRYLQAVSEQTKVKTKLTPNKMAAVLIFVFLFPIFL